MHKVERILVVQTAFLGDVVLTLPLVQVARQFFAPAKVDVLTIPGTAGILDNHPDIHEVIQFDKRREDSGFGGWRRTAMKLRANHYDLAFVPHRSLRSAFLVWKAKIPLRIGFKKSAGRFMFTRRMPYDSASHEIERNLSLLGAFGIESDNKELPRLYPSETDRQTVDSFLHQHTITNTQALIAIAPGTVWNTKRWMKERFAELARNLVNDRFTVVLVGGKEDEQLCDEIMAMGPSGNVINAAGKLSLLQSAELLRRSRLLICNDSAPMHLAGAMHTPVVAIFGATIPGFGFAPYGKHDVVVETHGLNCRPCSIHGGDKCPIKTFVCMNDITVGKVYVKVKEVLGKASG